MRKAMALSIIFTVRPVPAIHEDRDTGVLERAGEVEAGGGRRGRLPATIGEPIWREP